METKRETPLPIFVVSGGTGGTAEHVVKAAMAQFADPNIEIICKSNVRTGAAAAKIAKQAAKRQGIVIHSLVAPKVRQALQDVVNQHNVPIIDILGPMLRVLNDHLEMRSRNQAGLLYKLEKEHFDRIDAVDFTLAHDDGQRLHDLSRAEVVLVGVSRVAKSVTCFYLASYGTRAANVPLFAGQDPPAEVLELPAEKVIGLTMNPLRLQAIRETRMKDMPKGSVDFYVKGAAVTREITQVNMMMKRHGWRTVDVSYMSVEEVAREVMSFIGR